MKVAFDTNVLIDAIVEQREYLDAQTLILAVAQEKIEGLITASSITDIYYILRKRIGHERAKAAIRNLLDLFEVADISGKICQKALELPMKDFEDAVLAICAKEAGAARLVTGDAAFLSETGSPIKVVTVKELLADIL